MADVKKLTEYFQNKKILITGGAGYIGYNITKMLKDVDCRIVCLDPATQPQRFPGSRAAIEFVAEDIRHKDIWTERLKGVDVVFHLAAQTSVYNANKEPLADVEKPAGGKVISRCLSCRVP
jgi:nucleoside-diphosphate-sugar epimerase